MLLMSRTKRTPQSAPQSNLQKHLRNTFLAGIFAAVPVGATVFLIWWVEGMTRTPLKRMFGLDIPFLGIPLALAGIYALGLIVTSLIGKWFLLLLDKLLSKLPLLREIYQAWKQVALTPGGKEGMYAKVVLAPLEGGEVMAFTSGECVPGDEKMCCVFVPNTPNPVTGRLYFVPRADCRELAMTAEEAFKFIISTANYIPPEVGATTAKRRG